MSKEQHLNIEDAVLVEKWRNGDIKAIEELVNKYQARIYNLILKICSNPDDAAELTQDVIVKLLENLNGFESRSDFYTWVFRIALNLTLNYRKRKRTVGFTSMDACIGQIDEKAGNTLGKVLLDEKTPDPAMLAQDNELIELVQKALGQLEDEQKTIIVLRDIENMDYAQIAEVLGVELGTVKSRLSRARNALRQILEAFLR